VSVARDALYNLLLTAGDVGVVAIARRPGRSGWMLALLAQPLAATLLAEALGEDLFGAMRLLAYGAFLHVPAVLVALAVVSWTTRRRTSILAVLTAAALFVVAIDAFAIEPHRLQLSRTTIASPKVSRPTRMVVLADIQMSEVGSYERGALKRALDEKPDLILMAGDYVQTLDDASRARVRSELGSYLASIHFAAPLGIYAVEGNVDGPGWTSIFDFIPTTTFELTKSVPAGEILVTGLAVNDSFDRTLSVVPSDRFQVVLGHSPDFALGRIDADLLVAGHTHGGQVRLPFIGPLLTFSVVPKAWAAGETDLGHLQRLVVSRGVGLERAYAPPLRFLCPPEIVVIDVLPMAR
jgi:predicted MPP superfamily phosphohydrolase